MILQTDLQDRVKMGRKMRFLPLLNIFFFEKKMWVPIRMHNKNDGEAIIT